MTWTDPLPHSLPGPGDLPGPAMDKDCCDVDGGCVRCDGWDEDDL